ncbi:MAG: hypothetical protein ACREN8_04325 [Candidatus Dormibacteraceae bacterium]
MPWLLIVLIGTQAIFTLSDFMGRMNMRGGEFTLAKLLKPWFLIYLLIRQIALLGQFFIFSRVFLGEVVTVLAAISIVISNLLGLLLLREQLSVANYIGVSLAVTAVLILVFV